jgi:thioredoxin-dependent peroxiredoxin
MATDTQPKTLEIGSEAPDFSNVLATGNRRINLSDYRGKFLIMVFYPKDQTPGCTKQLCDLRDDIQLFQGLNTEVLGVNPDGLESHERFVAAQNYPFPILVDEGASISRNYGALRPEGGIQRTVYIIDPQSRVLFAQQGMPSDEDLAQAIRNAGA